MTPCMMITEMMTMVVLCIGPNQTNGCQSIFEGLRSKDVFICVKLTSAIQLDHYLHMTLRMLAIHVTGSCTSTAFT